MKILAFDTANNSASVAISQGQKILAYKEELRPSMQAETIVPMIEGALADAKLTYDDLDYLAVTNGPGSFTGIRIGLAVAKGILFGTKIKGVAVSNFEFAYFRSKPQIRDYDKIFVLLNAYRGQLYGQMFDKSQERHKPALLNYNQAIELIEREEGAIVCAGSGVELIYDQIKLKSNLMVLPRFAKVKAMHICRYVDNMLASSSKLNTLIEPLYIRPADAHMCQLKQGGLKLKHD